MTCNHLRSCCSSRKDSIIVNFLPAKPPLLMQMETNRKKNQETMQMSSGSISIFILGKNDCCFLFRYMYVLFKSPWKAFSPFHWKFSCRTSCKDVCLVVWWTSNPALVNYLSHTLFAIFCHIKSSWLNYLLLSHLCSYESLNLCN